MIGEEGLYDVFVEKGFEFVDENFDFVVVGLDCDIIYEKLVKVCFVVCNGVTFIFINGDIVILIEWGLLLGNGLLILVVVVLIGVDLIFIGKLELIIME